MLRRLPGRPVLASESSAIIICSSLQQLPFIHLLLHFCNLPFALSALLMAVLLVLVVYGAQCGSSSSSSSPFCSPHWNGCTLAFCAGCDLPLRSRRFLLAVLAVPVQLQHIHTDTDSMATADQFSRRLQTYTYTHSLTQRNSLSLCVPFPSSKSHGGSRRSLCPSPRHYRLAFTHCTPGLNTFSLAKELTRSLFLLHSRWPCVCQTQLPVLYNCCPFPFDLFLSAGDFKSVLIMQMEPVLVNEYRGR